MPDPKDDKKTENGDKKPKAPEEKSVQTRHSVTIDGQEIRYTATAGTLLLKEEDDTVKASVFYVAYTRDDVKDVGNRPLTFSFNGGPGSSSVWMHLGMLGPRIVQMNEDGSAPPPPYKLRENPHSILDATDLVFIDPVGTGYSRPRRARSGSVPRLPTGHRIGGRVHPPDHHAAQTLVVAQVSHRRELRHHAGGRVGRSSDGATRACLQRRDADLHDLELSDGAFHRGQRSTQHPLPAHLHRHCLVSWTVAGGAARASSAPGARRGGSLCDGRVHAGPHAR
ncbi:MAG: hypothetical protein R2873_02755 [Caldilineaceae bacterium]